MADIIDDNACSSPPVRMEDIYIEEDSNLSLPRSDSILTSNSIEKKNSNKSRLSARLHITNEIIISDLHEYKWPPDETESHIPCRDKQTSDWFVLQEVVSSLMQVKSFKRRYPDLYRRSVDGWEKDWLSKQGMLPKGVGDLGLTALKSDDVLTLLERDFPTIHEQVVSMFHERKIQMIADQQKQQYQGICHSQPVRGSKLESLRRKSLKSASEFNRSLNNDRKRERLYYWDLQTMQIHVSHCKRLCRPTVTDESNSIQSQKQPITNDYPVMLLPGQFCSTYKPYNQHQLGYMPINSTRFSLPSPHLARSALQSDELMDKLEAANHSNSPVAVATATPTTPIGNVIVPSVTIEAANNLSDSAAGSLCSVCRVKLQHPIKCCDCGKSGHPDCMDVKDDMVTHIRTYNWTCIDCKKCLHCKQSTDEDQMIFCDRCDRGYHVFCVGLSKIPEGTWLCKTCPSNI